MKLRLSVLMAALAAIVVTSLPLQAADAALAGKWTAQVPGCEIVLSCSSVAQLSAAVVLRKDR